MKSSYAPFFSPRHGDPRRQAARPACAVSWGAGGLLATVCVVGLAPTPGFASGDRVDGATLVSPSVVAAPGGAPIHAFLDQKRVLSYPFEQVWPSSVRYLRIDRGYTITERDPDAGFILFSFPVSPDISGSGSLEMLRTTDASGRPSVELRVNTKAGPSHLPHTLLEGVAAKVREERGQPTQPPESPPPPPPPPPDESNPDDGKPPMMPPATEPGEPAP